MQSPLAKPDFDVEKPVCATVLVADDDPASCRFLCDGLRSLGAESVACADGTQALQSARTRAFDLLLLDCRMPGAGALQILTALRADPAARSGQSIAVATTAELHPQNRRDLLAAGFSDILMKPCGLSDLRRMLSLVAPTHADDGVLDDDAALIAAGDATTMHALRSLLRVELVTLERQLPALSRDLTALGERLHRLRSSCGFCGAAALATETAWLQQQATRSEAPPAALARFRQTLQTTLQALDDQETVRQP